MNDDPDALALLFRRWMARTAFGFALLTVAIALAYVLLGPATPDTAAVGGRRDLPATATLPLIYGIFVLYYVFNWRSVRRAFLSGISADDALKIK